jgi:hypothetical protein
VARIEHTTILRQIVRPDRQHVDSVFPLHARRHAIY